MSVFRIFLSAALLLLPAMAFGYIGPGSGISLLGGIWSVLVGIVLALAAILFFPIRLMIRRMRGKRRGEEAEVDADEAAQPEATTEHEDRP
ncbi:MAG: hypothetical protein R3323_07590 [Wenzhouxiangellaceae bacterium]|nr:hypothetical protein [Wenzhouxiangellaceae bacterium]